MKIKNINLIGILLLIFVVATSCSDYKDYYFEDKVVIPQEGKIVKVMTYNIYGARATNNPPADLDELAAVIKKEDPDYVMLQEVDAFTERSGKEVHQARDLAALLGMNWHYTAARAQGSGYFGDAILSKTEIIKTFDHTLSPAPGVSGETRSVCVVQTKVDDIEIYLACTHLDHLGDETNRVSQAEQLEKVMGEYGGTLIMGGDFNCLPNSRPMRKISSYLTLAAKGHFEFTFPSDKPNKTIDYIMYKPKENISVQNYSVINETKASDHRPVVSMLKIVR